MMMYLLFALAAIGAILILLLAAVALVVLIWGDKLFVAAIEGFFKDLTGG